MLHLVSEDISKQWLISQVLCDTQPFPGKAMLPEEHKPEVHYTKLCIRNKQGNTMTRQQKFTELCNSLCISLSI